MCVILIWLPLQRYVTSYWINTVTNVTQKRKDVWVWKLTQMLSIHRAKIRKPDFLYLFANLKYIAKSPNWSVAGCHGNHLKSGFMFLCAMYSYVIYSRMVIMQNFVFWVTFIRPTVFSQPEVLYRYHGNQIKITHSFFFFFKRHDLSSIMIYITLWNKPPAAILIKFMSKVGASQPIHPLNCFWYIICDVNAPTIAVVFCNFFSI